MKLAYYLTILFGFSFLSIAPHVNASPMQKTEKIKARYSFKKGSKNQKVIEQKKKI